MTTAAIELVGIAKTLGRFQLGPVSLSIPRGTIYGLIGPNGAGKTTTLDLLMGMGRTDAGAIRILGRDAQVDEVAIKQRIAYVSPELNYQPWRTVRRAIEFVRSHYPDWDQARCERLQREFGVAPHERIATLSFGARIKLALIMALSRAADLLLLDEPSVGLDALSRRQLFTELLGFMQREDRTILIASHQIADLERFADHVAILDRGQLLLAGRIDELLERLCAVHARVAADQPLPAELGRVLRRDAESVQLLVDRTRVSREALARSRLEVVAEVPLTLEDLFIALVGPAARVETRNHGAVEMLSGALSQ